MEGGGHLRGPGGETEGGIAVHEEQELDVPLWTLPAVTRGKNVFAPVPYLVVVDDVLLSEKK